MIEPKVLKGTRDYGPDLMAKRLHVMGLMRAVFESFGYGTIETPVIEYAETILGKYGDEGDKLTYHFKDHGDRHIALRYDQTVPTARYYAANWQELPRPFKRYQISRVWRADKPQKGRQREFYQLDIDIIGTDNPSADLEVLQVVQATFEKLGLDDYVIQFNNRGLMNNLLAGFGVEEAVRVKVIHALDKLEKIGRDAVGDIIEDLGVTAEHTERLLDLVMTEGSNQDKIEALREFEPEAVEEILKMAEAAGMDMTRLDFNPALARGLDYYTGIVLEVVLEEARDLGSVCAGGRYDNLCGMFCKEQFSGVGIAFGFARISTAMLDRGMLDNVHAAADVLVVQFSEETREANLALASQLRAAGLNTEFYLDSAKLAKQFKFANKKLIPFVVTQGESELEKDVVILKDMTSGEQSEVALTDLAETIKVKL